MHGDSSLGASIPYTIRLSNNRSTWYYVCCNKLSMHNVFVQAGGRGLQARTSVDSDPSTCPIKNATKGLASLRLV